MSPLDLLLDGIFDYAGLFPPASLSLDEALKRSAGAPHSLKRPGIVGADMVLGFERLAELDSKLLSARGFPQAKTVRLAVLGPTVDDPDPVAAAAQIKEMTAFNEKRASDPVRQRIVSYEIKWKLDGFTHRENARVALDRVRREFGAAPIRLFVEPDWGEALWEERWSWFWQTLDALNASPEHPSVCPKLRGSGPTAIEPRRLARFIAELNPRSLPFKATAGLHHPVMEKDRYGNALGFLSLAAALRLQRHFGPEKFSEAEVEACLREEDAGNFSFEGGLTWKDFSITEVQLRDAVLSQPFGIGSCSLEEPDADLYRLFPSLQTA